MTKKIEAIIRQEKLNAVKNALSEIGIVGLNVFEVRGRGRGEGLQFHWRTGAYKVDLLPRVQVNIILSDENVDATVKAIVKAAHTGEKGDGMIICLPGGKRNPHQYRRRRTGSTSVSGGHRREKTKRNDPVVELVSSGWTIPATFYLSADKLMDRIKS